MTGDSDPEVEVVQVWDVGDEFDVIEFNEPSLLDDAVIVSVSRTQQASTDNSPKTRVRQFVQETPASRWVVPHTLGRRAVPMALYDDQGRLRSQWNVSHPELNRMIIDMEIPTAGTLDYI